MLDIGMAEMMVIGVVALIVVGPKDLPKMFRKVGNFMGRMRGMARDFQSAMNAVADQSEINDIKSTFDDATNLKNLGLDDVKAASTNFEANLLNDEDGEDGDAIEKSTEKPLAQTASQKPKKTKKAVKKTTSKAPSHSTKVKKSIKLSTNSKT